MVAFSAFSIFMLVSAVSLHFFSIQIIKFDDGIYFHLITFLLLSLIFIPITLFNSTVITINTPEKKITFKNVFAQARIYNFNELQGYIETEYVSRVGRVIYLIKDNKQIERISENYYSNFENLKLGLSSLNYMGKRTFNIYTYLKVLFRFPVSD